VKPLKRLLVTTLIAVLVGAFAAPVLAEKPSEVTGVWFVWSLASGATTGNDVAWTGDGTVLHNNATYLWNLMRSPITSGTVQIGTVETHSNLMFNTVTGEGNVLIKATLTFTEADKTKNPYGVGTLECTAVAKITSMNAKYQYVFGNGDGFTVSNTGTGDFDNAKLTADLVMGPIPATGTVQTEGVFFGVHQRVNGEGIIVFH
jgi:hypothetical protein